jgi:pimeloyl-ACP methyl ester carboxylesterase
MRTPRITRPALLASLLLAVSAGAQTPAAQMAPCTIPGLQEPARCGTVQVPENRDRPGGRMLSLKVVVVPAHGQAHARNAFTFFGGGPGQSVTPMAGGIPPVYAGLLEGRDLLFVDQRGTGGSSPLECNMRDPANPQSYLDDFLPLHRAATCRDSLARNADLTRYTFPDLAHDIEAVRVALGYDKLDLWGGSYGTRAAQVYLRMYPGSVRTVVLDGVVPPDFLQPASYARDTEAALTGLARACHQDAACAAAFPDPVGESHAVAQRLEGQPGVAEVVDPETGRIVRLTMSRGTFAETVRKMMYEPTSARLVPFVVHRAYEGDFRPAVRYGLADRRGSTGSSWGLYLALTCTEDVPFIDQAAAARENGTTLLGDYRVRQQADACAGWPVGTVPANYHQPVSSDAPVLMVSGEFDPVTPPRGGVALRAIFPNSTHLVVPGAAHGYSGMQGGECVDSMIVEFVRRGTAQGLDTSCVQRVSPPPFVLEVAETIRLEPAALERFAGSYANAEMEVRVEPVGGTTLRLTGPDFVIVLAPLTATRFQAEGYPPGYEFEFSPDVATATMRLVGRPDQVMARKP